MPHKTAAQLSTLSGVDAVDYLVIYDFSETESEKLKKISYDDFTTDIGTNFAGSYHTHNEVDIQDLDKYTQAEVTAISGVLQTAIDGKAASSHSHVETDITDLDKYTQAEVDSAITTAIDTVSGTLQSDIDSKSDSGHDHNDIYFTETELTTGGALDGRYYTENEIGSLLADKSDTTHTHTVLYYTTVKKIETNSTGVKVIGHVIPDMTTGASGVVSAYDLGSPSAKFKSLYVHDAYIDASSLYVNDKKVIEDVSDTITVSTDVDQDLRVKTTGQGIVYLNSEDEVDIHADGGIQVEVPSTLSTKHINFTNMSTNGNITFSADGSGAQVQFSATEEIDLTAPSIDINGNLDVSGTFTASNFSMDKLKSGGNTKVEAVSTGANVFGNLTISGDMTVSGTTTTVDTQDLLVTDKIITVNNGEVGAGLTGGTQAGMEVDRGSETNYKFVFDETQDNFRIGETGSEQAVATREDSPSDGYVPVWDSDSYMFSTASGLAVSNIWHTGNDSALAKLAGTNNYTGNAVYGNNVGIYVKTTGDTNRFVLKMDTSNEVEVGNTAHPLDLLSDGNLTHNGQPLSIDSSNFVVKDDDSTISGTLTATALKVKNDGGQMSGTLEVGSSPTGINPMAYYGYFYATKVYNAVWNDIADFQQIADEYIAGKCYFDTLEGAMICTNRCQKAVIGILSDTFGFGVGNREADDHAPFAVAGWVLAFVNGECVPGDVLTNDADGNLVKMNQQEKSMYPERIVAIYKKPEPAETWGPEGSEITVNGRHWVKVK